MADRSNYFCRLWNLYRLIRNTGRTKEQIERLQKKKLDKEILMEHFDELVTDRSLQQKELLKYDESSEGDGIRGVSSQYHYRILYGVSGSLALGVPQRGCAVV